MKRIQNSCLSCKKELSGRVDKKYCNEHCKSAYHYVKAQELAPNFFNKVDNQLKLNRRILKQFNKAGKATVRADKLIEAGFNPFFFTHYWKNKNDDVYLFCYEYGFLKKVESFEWDGNNKKVKYVLVEWQEYMEK